MPQRRAMRAGTTAAMSIGALTLILVTAGPAQAAEPCPPGTDIDSTLKNWECQWNNLVKPSPSPTKAPAVKKPDRTPVKKAPVAKSPGSGGSGKSDNRPSTTSGTSGSGGAAVDGRTPVGASSRGGRLTPYAPDAGDLSGALPQPAVAAAPLPGGSPTGAGTVLQTRLMAPMSAAEHRQDTQILWVAAASALAGAVGALNISVAGRRLRGGRR